MADGTMTPLDIIRGLLAHVPACLTCGDPATRDGIRASGRYAHHCDACPCDDPHEYRDAPAIRAAVRLVAEAEATPSGERVVWSDESDGLAPWPARLVVNEAGFLRYEEAVIKQWSEEDLCEMPTAARMFLGRAALAYVGAAEVADTEPAPAMDGGAA